MLHCCWVGNRLAQNWGRVKVPVNTRVAQEARVPIEHLGEGYTCFGGEANPYRVGNKIQ